MDLYKICFLISFLLVISLNEWFCLNNSLTREISGSPTSKHLHEGYKARIANGSIISLKDYAYNVYIFTKKNDGSGKGFSCGGSIIGVKWILTAGHCLPSGISVQNMKVFVGSKQRFKGKQYEVERAIKHPKFELELVPSTNISYHVYDYMILKLSKDLKYSTKVKRIEIGSYADIATGRKAILTGYGRTSKESGPGTTENNFLQKGEFIMSSYLDCHRIGLFMDFYEFCARKKGSSALLGDSGSPLVTKSGSRLIGVMSGGQNATDGQHTDIYCSVPYVQPWIQKTMEAK